MQPELPTTNKIACSERHLEQPLAIGADAHSIRESEKAAQSRDVLRGSDSKRRSYAGGVTATDRKLQKGKSRQAEAFSDEFSDDPNGNTKYPIAINYSKEPTCKYPRQDSNL